jgi:hypothetical protein
MNKLTGKGLAEFALSKLKTPYVYAAKGADGVLTRTRLNQFAKAYPSMFTAVYMAKATRLVGKVCCDCSGLISWYTHKLLGSAQLYSTASKRGSISDIKHAPIGAVLWHTGHVGVYIGNGCCVEEKGIDFGCVKSKITNTHFTHWLTFDYMEYEWGKESVKTSRKQTNPYAKPATNVKYKMKGDSVRWVQFELNEAGYKVTIDGDLGDKTLKAIKEFQRSCKLVADGIVGKKTIAAFVADK